VRPSPSAGRRNHPAPASETAKTEPPPTIPVPVPAITNDARPISSCRSSGAWARRAPPPERVFRPARGCGGGEEAGGGVGRGVDRSTSASRTRAAQTPRACAIPTQSWPSNRSMSGGGAHLVGDLGLRPERVASAREANADRPARRGCLGRRERPLESRPSFLLVRARRGPLEHDLRRLRDVQASSLVTMAHPGPSVLADQTDGAPLERIAFRVVKNRDVGLIQSQRRSPKIRRIA